MEIGWRRMKSALMTYSHPLQLAGNIVLLMVMMTLWPVALAVYVGVTYPRTAGITLGLFAVGLGGWLSLSTEAPPAWAAPVLLLGALTALYYQMFPSWTKSE